MWLQVPSLDADYGMDAAHFLSQATGGGLRMTACIERRERRQQTRGKDPLASQPFLHIVLSKEGASAADSVNADMLRAGFARVKAGKNKQVAGLVLHEPSQICLCSGAFWLPGSADKWALLDDIKATLKGFARACVFHD